LVIINDQMLTQKRAAINEFYLYINTLNEQVIAQNGRSPLRDESK